MKKLRRPYYIRPKVDMGGIKIPYEEVKFKLYLGVSV